MKFRTTRTLALLSVSGLAFIAADVARAQTTPQEGGDGLQEVVVTGNRAAITNALETKRNAEEIVDSISAVDIGALPDRSVTEALQRIPGISIGRTDEPRDIDRLNVEGSGVQIRGLSWVRTELNGRDTFGAKNGRSLGWEDVTPELAAGVDVYKNPSADIVEGGVGGTINLRTRMPFDSKDPVLAVSGDATYGDLRQKWTPSGSVLGSYRYDTRDAGEFGILVDLAHSETKYRENAIEVDPYDAHSTNTQASYDGGATLNSQLTGVNGNNAIAGQPLPTVMVPTGVEWRLEDRDKIRDGLFTALQWRPDEHWEVYGTYFRSQSRLISTDYFAQTSACCSETNNQNFLNGPATGTNFTFSPNGNFLSGQIQDGEGGGNGVANSFLLNLGTRYAVEHDETEDASTGVRWQNDRWTVNGDFQHINSKRTDYDMTVYNTVTVPGGIGLNLSGDTPQITANNLTGQPDYFNLYAAMDHDEIDKAHQFTGKLDATYDANGDFLRSIKVGFRATDRRSIQMDGGYNWALITAPWAFTQTATVSQFPQNQQIVNFNNFFGGSVSSPPSLWMPTLNLAQSTSTMAAYLQKLLYTPNLGKNLAAYNNGDYGYYCSTCGNGSIPYGNNAGKYSPFPQGSLASYLPIWAAANLNSSGQIANLAEPVGTNISFWQPFNGNYNYPPTSTSGIGINDQEEQTKAVYAMARFAQHDLFGLDVPWDGNLGIRAVRTDTVSRGVGSIASIPLSGDASAYSAAADEALQFANGATTETRYTNHYTDLLPSLNLRFMPRDDTAIRFAAGESIVRPDFYQLQPSFSMSGTLQSRNAVVSDNIFNTATGKAYTQSELDTLAAAGTPVKYNTGAAFAFNSGNPNLKPMRADSFDLTYEWYPKPGSIVALGVFDKEIHNYIQSDQTVTSFTNNGVTETIVGTMPQNHGHGRVLGMEGQATYFYDFLPEPLNGLGTDFNVTILDSSGQQNASGSVFDGAQVSASKLTLPLEQLSTYTLNAALLYAHYGFDFRLAYNWRSRYLMAASASNVEAPAYMEDYGQLDTSLFYTVNDNIKVGVEAANILGAKNIIDIDERDNWYYGTQGNMSNALIYKHNWNISDRRLSLALRAVF
jgi:TonB-dependent receptor